VGALVDSNKYEQKLAEQLITFYKSEVWAVIKYRLMQYALVHENTALNKIRQREYDKALNYTSLADGIRGAIKLTEQLSSELNNGKLDADAALGVIENKQEAKEEVGGRSWIQKILMLFRVPKRGKV
jgi:hypothetical protein